MQKRYLLVALGLLACTSAPVPATNSSATQTVAVATFNAGLARNFVGLAAERVDPVAKAVAGLDADIVCLEEVWEDQDVTAVLAAATPNFPYNYHVATSEDVAVGTPSACTPGDAAPLKACVDAHCATAPTLSDCALKQCGKEYLAASHDCQTCLAANIYLNSIPKIFDACAASSATKFEKGRNGVILLSKVPLQQTSVKMLDSFLIQRVVLNAKATIQGQPTHVFCTHIQAGLGDVAYSGKYGSWQGEQKQQLLDMTAWMNQIAGTDPLILLGDLNCGPVLPPDIKSDFPENFVIVQNELHTTNIPFINAKPPICSWCDANLLTEPTPDQIIDHVVLRDGMNGSDQIHLGSQEVSRILDQPITVNLPSGPTTTNLSDHYGVRVRVVVAGPGKA